MNLENKDDLATIVKIIRDSNDRLEVNDQLIKIMHGNISEPLIAKLKKDMPETYKDAIDRLAPVNFCKRINDKITHIYQTGVKRTVEPQNKGDQDAIDEYVEAVGLNDELDYNNQLYNLFGYSLQSLAVDEFGKNYSVAVDNNMYIPVSLSANRKNRMDLLILVMEKRGTDQIYWIWTNDQFAIIDGEGKLRWDLIAERYADDENFQMTSEYLVNPFGVIPYQYLTSSKTSIMPEIAHDTLALALIIPLIYTDMGYVSKYTAFSILYTVDLDTTNLPQAPNATWNLKSGSGEDLGSDAKPEIGTIKPNGDIQSMIDLTMALLTGWLEAKGIPTGGIGKVDAANYSSGISKIIDELDISDLREKQTKVYRTFERNYFDRYMHDLNPVFIADERYTDVIHIYNSASEVVTEFPIQRPILNRMEVINEVEKELGLGLLTKRQALVRLYPELSEEDIDSMLEEIDSEGEGESDDANSPNDNGVNESENPEPELNAEDV